MTLLNGEVLRGRTANSVLADWFEQLSAKMKEGEDPSIQMAFSGDEGRECIVEFRVLSVPGKYERSSFKVEVAP